MDSWTKWALKSAWVSYCFCTLVTISSREGVWLWPRAGQRHIMKKSTAVPPIFALAVLFIFCLTPLGKNPNLQPLFFRHDLRQSRGLENRAPLKVDENQPLRKGWSPSAARPGVKGIARRNHEAPSVPETGWANRSGIPVMVSADGRSDRWSLERPTSSCGSGSASSREWAHPADAFCGQSP